MVWILTDIIVNFLTLEFMVSNSVEVVGSVRVDLLGGTLDLNPINLILPNVVTLNLATSLKAKVKVSEIDFDGIEIKSLDYQSVDRFKSAEFTEFNLQKGHFKHLTFIAHILNLFSLTKGLCLELESGSPPGAGLGGSSAMGVTCFSALAKYKGQSFNRTEAIMKVKSLEARILDCGPAGYQDYYPALFGGVLALIPKPGSVEVEQLFSTELKIKLESRITLAYSGETRLSGINNWEVYKAFFNKDPMVRKGMEEIAKLSHEAYLAIKNNDFEKVISLIGMEGEERRRLFPGILTPNMNELYATLKNHSQNFGMKICGAGGGGCFLITHQEKDHFLVKELLAKFNMKQLPFEVEGPI